MMGGMVWDLIAQRSKEHGLPTGFRFHPTDEELITFYLASKVYNGGGACGVRIVEIDLNRCEPWDLPDIAKMGEREWYFYSLKDRKYPTGLRTNRATGCGYWKATGKDREVYNYKSSPNGGCLVGMKKTLVFYHGRAPRGEKTKWVLHEYRLDGELSNRHASKDEWVICRIFHKAAGAGSEKNSNPFLLNNSYFLEPSYFSSSIPFPPSLMAAMAATAEPPPPPPPPTTTTNIQTFLQNNTTFYNTIIDNQVIVAPAESPPPLSLLKSHPNHDPVKETVPVPKRCNVQTLEDEDADADAVLKWLQYSNNNPHHDDDVDDDNPFVFDAGLFNSSLSCGAAAHIY